MNRVVHFEIHAADPERAAAFYRAVFDWDVKEWVIPGVQIPNENRSWLAYCKDTEGNIFGMMQDDPSAG